MRVSIGHLGNIDSFYYKKTYFQLKNGSFLTSLRGVKCIPKSLWPILPLMLLTISSLRLSFKILFMTS